MDENYIRRRITELRIQKNVSEYKMSMDLGHSKGYIQSISSGRALPSMSEFLAICDYFDIAPLDFFNDEGKNILISTHAIAMKGLLEYLTPESEGSYWSKYIGNCAIYGADLVDGHYTVPEELRVIHRPGRA